MPIQTNIALGLVTGTASANGSPLVNYPLQVREMGSNSPLRIYASADPSSLLSKSGETFSLADGSYSFYVLQGKNIAVRAVDQSGRVIYSSHDNQAGDLRDSVPLRNIQVSTQAAVNNDGRPDGTIWINI